jgi:protein-S-isoprenylcysteine O-methyltransferase Ste14
MARVALLLEVAFLVLAFGVRSALHHRRTGSFGFRGVSGRVFSAEWWGGVLFVAALILAGVAPVVAAPAPVEAWRTIPFVLGLLGTLHAQRAMGVSWRIGVDDRERTTLIDRGPFRYVRNPIFTWMTFALVGLIVMVPNVWSLLALIAMVAAIELQVRRVEEPYLLRAHGAAYARYAARTGRFIPGLGTIGSRAAGT